MFLAPKVSLCFVLRTLLGQCHPIGKSETQLRTLLNHFALSKAPEKHRKGLELSRRRGRGPSCHRPEPSAAEVWGAIYLTPDIHRSLLFSPGSLYDQCIEEK